METPPQDDGVAGARVGVEDDNTTGRFTAQNFVLDEQLIQGEGDVAAAFRKLVEAGHRLVVADLSATALLAIAELPEAKSVLLLNVAAKDDALRGETCRANILHLMPSRAMPKPASGRSRNSAPSSLGRSPWPLSLVPGVRIPGTTRSQPK